MTSERSPVKQCKARGWVFCCRRFEMLLSTVAPQKRLWDREAPPWRWSSFAVWVGHSAFGNKDHDRKLLWLRPGDPHLTMTTNKWLPENTVHKQQPQETRRSSPTATLFTFTFSSYQRWFRRRRNILAVRLVTTVFITWATSRHNTDQFVRCLYNSYFIFIFIVCLCFFNFIFISVF